MIMKILVKVPPYSFIDIYKNSYHPESKQTFLGKILCVSII